MSVGLTRVTFALGKEEDALLKSISKENSLSTSEVIRRALKFYCEYTGLLEGALSKKIRNYLILLPKGEHLIVDVGHWILFMKMVQELPASDQFWDSCVDIAKDHAEEFRGKIADVQAVLERLEDCNFFRVEKH